MYLVLPALAGLIGLILLWLGLRLLARPFRWAARSMRASTVGLHPAAFWAAFAVAVAIEPDPFLQIARAFVGLVALIVLALPQLALELAGLARQDCSAADCTNNVLQLLTQFWQGSVADFARTLAVPDGLTAAAFIFAAAVGLAFAAQRSLTPGHRVETTFGKVGFLLLSMAAALYFCITAIIAIPVFSDRTSRLEEDKRVLAEALPKQREAYLDSVNKLEKLDDQSITAALGDLETKVDTLWAAPSDKTPSEQAERYNRDYKQTVGTAISGVLGEIVSWEQLNQELNRARTAFGDDAKQFIDRVNAWLVLENTGHLSGHLTDQHTALLMSRSNLWLAGYYQRLVTCRALQLSSLNLYQSQVDAIGGDLQDARKMTEARPGMQPQRFSLGPPQVVQPGSPAPLHPCFSIAADPAGDALPARPGPGQELGVFWKATHWLLATESSDLALIIGLLGFGFFGALATSFIRQFAQTPGAVLPSSGWIVPALVRGVAAAILVFLAVQGGIAVFTQTGGSLSPNPYAVFLACFVAAVYSEEVWAAALARLQEQTQPETDPKAGDKTASKTSTTTPRPGPVPGWPAPAE